MNDIKEQELQQYSDLEKIELGSQFLRDSIKKNNYKNQKSLEIDIEWLEAFIEWRDIYNERVLAKSRVL